MKFFKRQKHSKYQLFITFLQEQIKNLENETLSQEEKNNIFEFFIRSQISEFSNEYIENNKISYYLFLGWWITQQMNEV